jgi:hypothetical protein
MWGLTEKGSFICPSSDETKLASVVSSVKRMLGIAEIDVYTTVMSDLSKVREALLLETSRCRLPIFTDVDRGRRLLFLFQKDLIPYV